MKKIHTYLMYIKRYRYKIYKLCIINVSIHIGDNYQVEFEMLPHPVASFSTVTGTGRGGASQGIITMCSTEGYILLRVLHLYVPSTQMTLVLIGKGLVLGG